MFYTGFMPGAPTALASKFKILALVLDERARRLVAAAEAEAMGFGRSNGSGSGERPVARHGDSRHCRARRSLRSRRADSVSGDKVRSERGPSNRDAGLKRDLESLVEPVTRGDPESSLRWTCKSVRQLAAELKRMNHQTSHRMVAELLHEMEYSLQANSQTLEGSAHPDRDAQFHPSQTRAGSFSSRASPLFP